MIVQLVNATRGPELGPQNPYKTCGGGGILSHPGNERTLMDPWGLGTSQPSLQGNAGGGNRQRRPSVRPR